jgi:ribosome-binding factor A
MTGDIRILRLEKLALHRASEVVLRELSDPRLTLVTLVRVELARDLSYGTVFWSILGTPGDRSKAEHALRDATGVVQSAVAKVFRTRRTPKLRFEFDPSIEGSIRVGSILNRLELEREEREKEGKAPEEE